MSKRESTSVEVPFIDLASQRERLGERIDRAIADVLDHGRFILGPEVRRFEEELCAFAGADYAVGCANGTDALVLAVRCLGLGKGDGVLVPSFTFSASAESVVLAGATPVFVDVLPDTFNVDPAGLAAGVDAARGAGLTPRAIMTVDLFGQPADYDPIVEFCRENGLLLIDDAAQSFGATYRGARIGSLGTITTTSFFPSKPLACYGDGGALLTDDPELDTLLRSLRVHGQGKNKYDNLRIGMNSRLDTLQAAILSQKLSIFEDEIAERQIVAARYNEGLSEVVTVPAVIDGAISTWALYTVRVSAERRDRLRGALAELGVPTGIYYPLPLHEQPAYREYPRVADLPVSVALCDEVLSLPMHAYLDEELQGVIVDAVRRQ